MAHEGFKALLVVLGTVGNTVPPMKAAAARLTKVLTLIDVCIAASQWMIVRELMTLMRQNVVKDKADYDAIRQTLEGIISMAVKLRQDGSQRHLNRKVEEMGNVCHVIILHELPFTSPSVLSSFTRIRSNIYRSDGSSDVRLKLHKTPIRL